MTSRNARQFRVDAARWSRRHHPHVPAVRLYVADGDVERRFQPDGRRVTGRGCTLRHVVSGKPHGLGLLPFGMELTSAATAPLRSCASVIGFLQGMRTSYHGIRAGLVFTAIVQSSLHDGARAVASQRCRLGNAGSGEASCAQPVRAANRG